MENYPSYSYPESGDSSPRSREIDFENPPPSWEDSTSAATTTNYKVKFMVSYGGKIQPRSHDNLLSYVGGETKILAVDRNVRFSSIYSKLASLVSSDTAVDQPPSPAVSTFTFKYQLPGEDLDALISVTNDDDLEHMMHEYDRMCRASPKPARLRLFIFPDQRQSSAFSSTSSDKGLDRVPDRFVEALNSGPVNGISDHTVAPPVVVAPAVPVQSLPPQQPPPPVNVSGNVDFLFGLDKVPVQVPVQAPVRHEPVGEPELVHELNRLQISAQELHHQQQLHHHHQQQQQQHQQQQQQAAALYQQKSEENLASNFADPYHKPPPQANVPTSVPQIPAGYWQQVEQHQNLQPQQPPPQQQPQPQYHHQHPHHQQPQQQQQQPVYMMHAPPQSNVYHAPVGRPVAANQGYYQVQRMPTDQVYREQQPVYSTPASVAAATATGQLRAETAGFAQVGYDSATGRQVYYTAGPQGGVVATPYQGVPAAAIVSGDMRSSGDGKVGPKVVPSSGAV